MSEQTLKPGMYRHFKGGIYEVLGVAEHSEQPEEFVVYRVLDGSKRLFVRPMTMFVELVNVNGQERRRFEFVDGQTITDSHHTINAT